MATASENTEIALLKNDFGNMKLVVDEIRGDVKTMLGVMATMPQNFVTVEVFAAYKLAQVAELSAFRKKSWAQNFLSALAGVVLTALVGVMIYLLFHHQVIVHNVSK